MSKGYKNSAHTYNGGRVSRAGRLASKLKGQGQRAVTLKRLEELLRRRPVSGTPIRAIDRHRDRA